MINVCTKVAKVLKKGDIVIFESTVFLELLKKFAHRSLIKIKNSLKSGIDFFRLLSRKGKPGDKLRTIDKIDKVISGQNKNVEKVLKEIYGKLTSGKVFLAKNIKVAEASKVIENAQRDINIAFINEVAKICVKLNISVYDVLEASKTKWNFLPFTPGLVGGHCIGVDPYYLSYKAEKLGVKPEVILSGRKTNDQMTKFVFKQIKKMLKGDSKVLFLGVTFKEDVPDLRNSKALELLSYFNNSKFNLTVNDPFVNSDGYKSFKEIEKRIFLMQLYSQFLIPSIKLN